MKQYLIYSAVESIVQDEPMYWSNSFGWVDESQADTFTELEKNIVNLPDTGIWVVTDLVVDGTTAKTGWKMVEDIVEECH